MKTTRNKTVVSTVFVCLFSLAWTATTVAVVYATEFLEENPPDQVFFSVTVRDFISAQCSGTDDDCPTEFSDDIENLPYQPHPDFEISGSGYVGGCPDTSAYDGNTFPVTPDSGCSSGNPRISQDSTVASSGIRKPILHPGGAPNMESDDSFSNWYNDNTTFNRRFGYSMTLDRVAGPGLTYEFDSSPNDDFYDPFKIAGIATESNWPSLKVWPISSEEKDGNAGKKFWFTTEIHTFFQYNGGESFTFSGDDDVYVFINDILALNIGGIHQSREATIELDNHIANLNISVGGIYAFDLFHAERQTTESNYKLTSSLSTACNVISTFRVAGERAIVIDWPNRGVDNPGELKLVGGNDFGFIDPVTNYTLLMSSHSPNSVGYMYFMQQRNTGGGFKITSKFQVTGEGEGMALVWQDSSKGIENLNGGVGPNFGLRDLDQYYAVVFNFCVDREDDCSQARVSLRRNHEDVVYEDLQLLKLNDGEIHEVEVDFYGDSPNWIEVYLDQSLYLVQRDVDIISTMGSRNAYVGWTATNGAERAHNVSIIDFRMVTVNIAEEFTVLGASEELRNQDFAPKALVGDNRDVITYTIQTRDFCEDDIDFGGVGDSAYGLLIEEVNPDTGKYFNGSATPLIGLLNHTNVKDNEDGSYGIQFSTEYPGNYTVVLAYGNCVLDQATLTFDTNTDDEVDEASGACWNETFPYAAYVTPAPQESDEEDDVPGGLDEDLVIGLVAGFGAIVVVGATAIFVLVKRFRNKWREGKKFIEKGKEVEAEKNVVYTPDTEADMVARKLMETRAALNAERARGGTGEELQKQIDDLNKQNEQISEQLRDMKKQQQESRVAPSAGAGAGAATMTSRTGGRKQFGAEHVSVDNFSETNPRFHGT